MLKDMEIFKLKKPDLLKKDSEYWTKLFSDFSKKELAEFVFKKGFSSRGNYLFWDIFKHEKSFDKDKENLPIDWHMLKIVRKIRSKRTPIKTEKGDFFSYVDLPNIDQFLHEIDLNWGGKFSLDNIINERERKKVFLNGLSEEAIASAQIEGAHSTRKVAKKLIKEGRKPKNKSEQMIFNNYEAIMKIESEYSKQKLSIGDILNLHKLITKHTLDNEDEAGRFRKKDEEINIVDDSTSLIHYKTPNISFVEKEMEKFIKFINDEDGNFVHPVIKAIMIHFWIAYLHPFVDGNGRMARLLFYWYLLRHELKIFAYLPISLVIKESQKDYSMAYVYSEQDDEDLTYFIDYNISKIKQAMKNFEMYLGELKKEIKIKKRKSKELETEYGLNYRQIELLEYLSKNEINKMTLKMYVENNKISKATGLKDIKVLKNNDWIEGNKLGRSILYFITEKGINIVEK